MNSSSTGCKGSSAPVFQSMSMISLQQDHVLEASSRADTAAKQSTSLNPQPFFTTKTYNTIEHTCWANPRVVKVPLFYPLSSSHVVFSKQDLDKVLRKLVQTFRTCSLQTRYSNQPVSAQCTSIEQAELEVRLWESSDANTIVLEAYRISGDVFVSSKYIRKILSTPQALSATDENDMQSRFGHRIIRDGQATTSTNVALGAIEMAQSLLMVDRVDARILGLESLVTMTNPSVSGEKTAQLAAQSLAHGHHFPSVDSERLQEQILSLAMRGCWRDEIAEISAEEASSRDYVQAQNLALTILSQSVNLLDTLSLDLLVKKSDKLAQDIDSLTLVQALEAFVASARTSMHAACLAANVLTSLCQSIPELRDTISLESVEDAQQTGALHHVALSRATERLYVALTPTACCSDKLSSA